MSAAASEEAKARKQGAAKLEAHSAPSAGVAEADGQKHYGEAVDEKADVAACDEEQHSAAKPYVLIRVRLPEGQKSMQPATGLSTWPCMLLTPSRKHQPFLVSSYRQQFSGQALLQPERGALKVTRRYSAGVAAKPQLC